MSTETGHLGLNVSLQYTITLTFLYLFILLNESICFPCIIFNVSMVTQHLDVEAELVDVQLVGVHLEPLEAESAVSPVLPEVAVHAVVL